MMQKKRNKWIIRQIQKERKKKVLKHMQIKLTHINILSNNRKYWTHYLLFVLYKLDRGGEMFSKRGISLIHTSHTSILIRKTIQNKNGERFWIDRPRPSLHPLSTPPSTPPSIPRSPRLKEDNKKSRFYSCSHMWFHYVLIESMSVSEQLHTYSFPN